MKSLIVLISLILPFTSMAFIARDQQPALVEALNKIQPSFSHVESLRCSSRGRACVVKLVLHNTHEVGCVVSGLGDSSEIYEITSNGQIKIAPYFTESLDRCVASK